MMVIIECLDGIVFVFNEAIIAGIGPYCERVDLCALIVNLVRLYKTNQAKRASRSVLLRDWVHRLAGRMVMD